MARTADNRSSGKPRSPDFLIFASPKSGTTWLQLMLNAHPEVHCVESRAWGNEHRLLRGGRFHINLDAYARFAMGISRIDGLCPEEDGEDLAIELHGALLEWASSRTGKPVVGEKCTPYSGQSSYALDGFLRERSDLPIVHLVRDPRDVIVSRFVHHSWALPPENSEEKEALARDVAQQRVPQVMVDSGLRNWLDVEQAWSEHRGRARRSVEIRYEDLIDSPVEQLRCVFDCIGMSVSDTYLGDCVASASFEKLAGRERGQEDRGSFFRKGTPGDWANWLSREQDASVRRLAGELFDRLYRECGEEVA